MLPYIRKHEKKITPPALPKPTQKATIISFSIINVSHMKTYLILLAFITVCLVQCRKPGSAKRTDVPGLPPATQTGENTFGFLLNGTTWVPEGPNNLSIDFDTGFKNGILGIVAYRKINATNSTQIVIGISDSLNFMTIPISKSTAKNHLGFANYSNSAFCSYHQNDDSTYSLGKITISRLDRQNRIIAGSFECKLFNRLCSRDTIIITNGRFDMKF
jgi:hypothetical protein